MEPTSIYQLKVTLLGTKPPIWRRVLVPSEFTLDKLHRVLQTVMGWADYHLHEFRVGRETFGIPDPDGDLSGGPPTIHERKVRLSDVLTRRGASAEYIYDFGDGWEHAVVAEKILLPEPDQTYPLCTAGKRHCPPEDCGGIGGFFDFLEAIADPHHEQHVELLQWIGGTYSPELFSVDDVNVQLRGEFSRVRKTGAKKTRAKKTAAKTQEGKAVSLSPPAKAKIAAVESSLRPLARKRISPGEKVPLELNDRERELILDHTFADDDLTRRLKIVPEPGAQPIFHFTLEDLDELAGYVAAEANHAKNKKLGKELDHLFDRIDDLLGSYAEG